MEQHEPEMFFVGECSLFVVPPIPLCVIKEIWLLRNIQQFPYKLHLGGRMTSDPALCFYHLLTSSVDWCTFS